MSLAGPGSGSPLTFVELRQLGGALARPERSAGALASVPGSLCFFALGSPMAPGSAEQMVDRISQLTEALSAHDAGRLLNFVEQPYDTTAAFPGDAYRRLQEVKAAYDPDGVMHANHPVAAVVKE